MRQILGDDAVSLATHWQNYLSVFAGFPPHVGESPVQCSGLSNRGEGKGEGCEGEGTSCLLYGSSSTISQYLMKMGLVLIETRIMLANSSL